jgi:hypothetical protein
MNDGGKSEANKEQRKKRRIGLFLIYFPPIGLLLTLTLYSVAMFILSFFGKSEEPVGQLVSVFFGLTGVICTLGFFIAIPIGIHLFNQSKKNEEGDKPQLDPEEIKEQIKGWNWGAFFFNWIWGLVHKVWISLLMFIPIVNLGVMIYLGLKGNELAWEKGSWKSIEVFHARQRKWAIAAGIVFGLYLILVVFVFLSDTSS